MERKYLCLALGAGRRNSLIRGIGCRARVTCDKTEISLEQPDRPVCDEATVRSKTTGTSLRRVPTIRTAR